MTNEPFAGTYLPVFQALRDEWRTLFADEIAILQAAR
jgi:hypothetical protein